VQGYTFTGNGRSTSENNQVSLPNENLYRVPQLSVQQPATSVLQRYSAIPEQYLFVTVPRVRRTITCDKNTGLSPL
jgi:hypothetical protein